MFLTNSEQEKAREKRALSLKLRLLNKSPREIGNAVSGETPLNLFECYVNLSADVFARNKRIQRNKKFVYFGKLLTRFVRVANNTCTTNISEVILIHCYQSWITQDVWIASVQV